jgi:hypothetical protein
MGAGRTRQFAERMGMLGYTNAHDGQGINQWIYGRIHNPTTHPDAAISGGNFLPILFRDLQVDTVTETLSLRRVTGAASYRVFAFDDEDETDPENAIAYISVTAPAHDIYQGSQWATLDEFNISALFDAIPEDAETVFFRVQAIAPVFPVRGQTGVNWGENSPISLVAEVVDDDPFAGAAEWALPYLPDALDAGLLTERMFGAWTEAPTRVEAAADIVRFAQVFTGAEDLVELFEIMGLESVDEWNDSDDENAIFLRAAGISDGVGDGYFDPDGSFTRAAMVVMIYRLAMALDLEVDDYALASETFDDVPDWPQHQEAVGWAYAVGITTGEGGRRFNPLGALQNQHVAVFALRALRNLSEG